MDTTHLDKVRSECSAASDHLFFNTAGSSLPSDKSIEIVLDFIKRESKVGGYKLMVDEASRFEEFYIESAKLINCKPRNIAFAQSATSAFSQALYSINWEIGDIVLMSKLEYVSNILSLQRLSEVFGIELKFITPDEYGLVDVNELKFALDKYKPKALVLTHIPTNTGVIQDAEKVGELCKEHDCIYILDACQSIGHIDVNVEKIGCDFLSVTGRKYLRGPRGTGFLYVNDRFIDSGASPICIDLAGAKWTDTLSYEFHDNAKRWEFWEKNYANLLGLTQSIREINTIGIIKVESYNKDIQEYYREILASIDDIEIQDQPKNNCSIITWRPKNYTQSETADLLSKCGVIYSMTMIESALIDMRNKGINWAIRFSPHYFNTKQEIDLFKERWIALQ